jgi:hypothetical protein
LKEIKKLNAVREKAMSKLVKILIGGIWIITIVVMIAVAVFIFKGGKYIKQHGLKYAVERIWQGQQ